MPIDWELALIIEGLLYRFPKLGVFIQGEPILLVYKGRINRQNLNKARISNEELEEAIHEHGVLGVKDVDLDVLEIDGNISILSGGYQKKTTKKHRSHKVVEKIE
jgi:Predicted membrane protein